jgi:predicted amidohydrolase
MRQPLTIAAAQPLCHRYDVATNAFEHAAAVRAAEARVVLFPELSLTGYHMDAPVVAPHDDRLRPLIEACREVGAIAIAGAPVPGVDAKPNIGLLAISRGGVTVAYRKIWLGGEEPEHFAPGTEPAALEADGWRLGLAICKDTGILQHAADTAALGLDAYLAAVLEHAENFNVPDQRARRIAAAHAVWVVVASFAGSTGAGYEHAAGGSGIWSPHGEVVARADGESGSIVRAVLT